MLGKSTLLELDGIGNLLLGVLFLVFPDWISGVLGLPASASRFYPIVLGAVLFGIGFGVADAEIPQHAPGQRTGSGASVINLCFGLALTAGRLRARTPGEEKE